MGSASNGMPVARAPSEALLQRALLAAEAAGIQAVIILNKADLPETARTGDISTALDSGKHTTTHAQLYDLNEKTQLIDSPGLQEFGLHHLQAAELLQYFPDLSHLVGQCRFHNCTHCAVKPPPKQAKPSPNVSSFCNG